MNDLERRFNQLRQFNETLDESRDEDLIGITTSTKNALERDTIELVANQIMTNQSSCSTIQVEPLRNYDNFKLADDGEISYVYKRTVIDLGNINERLKPAWEIRRLGVAKLKSMGVINITDEEERS